MSAPSASTPSTCRASRAAATPSAGRECLAWVPCGVGPAWQCLVGAVCPSHSCASQRRKRRARLQLHYRVPVHYVERPICGKDVLCAVCEAAHCVHPCEWEFTQTRTERKCWQRERAWQHAYASVPGAASPASSSILHELLALLACLLQFCERRFWPARPPAGASRVWWCGRRPRAPCAASRSTWRTCWTPPQTQQLTSPHRWGGGMPGARRSIAHRPTMRSHVPHKGQP